MVIRGKCFFLKKKKVNGIKSQRVKILRILKDLKVLFQTSTEQAFLFLKTFCA